MPYHRFATRILVATSILLVAFGTAASPAVAGAAGKAPDAHAPSGAAPVLDTDYALIDSPDPIKGPKVQVVEIFGYGCPYCAHFQPTLAEWEKTLPADVQFSYLPATFGPDPEHCWDDFARAFYTAESMGVQAKSHDALYKAKFEQGRIETCAAIPSVYADFGPDPKVFASTMNSFFVNAKLAQSRDQTTRWGVDSTPTIVVDGKYRALLTRTGGPAGMLRTVDWLIARQRPLHAAHPPQRGGKH